MTEPTLSPPPESSPRNGSSPVFKGSRSSTLIITNIGKLVGMAIFVNEALIKAEARNSVMILCGVFVLGAQVVENIVLRGIERLFGGSQ